MDIKAPELPGWRHIFSGKVRDLYLPVDSVDPANPADQLAAPQSVGETPAADRILVVTSDRISAYDYVLPTTIPDKGKVLTALTLWWFDQLAELVPGHIISTEVPEAVAGRAMICQRLEMYPVECVARGYLTGSGLIDYQNQQAVCGVALPPGLVEGSRLPQPIFTPAAKADFGEHDQNIDFAAASTLVGADVAAQLRDLTLAIYQKAAEIALEQDLIIADTKFEFGTDTSGQIVLGDEVLTPDSSRFWGKDDWVPGKVTPSFDKQYVRDWLTSPASGWNRASNQNPPELPAEVVAATRERYLAAYSRLTGSEL